MGKDRGDTLAFRRMLGRRQAITLHPRRPQALSDVSRSTGFPLLPSQPEARGCSPQMASRVALAHLLSYPIFLDTICNKRQSYSVQQGTKALHGVLFRSSSCLARFSILGEGRVCTMIGDLCAFFHLYLRRITTCLRHVAA